MYVVPKVFLETKEQQDKEITYISKLNKQVSIFFSFWETVVIYD